MEGGCGSNPPDRRAARIVHDFDLNVKLEPEEEPEQKPEQEQLPHNVAPEVLNPNPQLSAPPRIRVIHDLEEGSPGVDVVFDISKVEQQNQMDMLANSNKYAHAEKDLMATGVKILGYGGVNVRPRVVGNKDSNNAGAKEELTGSVRKRARTSATGTSDPIGSPGNAASSSAEKRSGTPKIRWKLQDKEGDTEIQRPSPAEERKP